MKNGFYQFLVFSLVLSLILPNIIEGTENTIYVQNFETGTELIY